MMNKSNFEFLKGVNDFTYAIACAAENNYPDDPNTTLIKMRMFGEATAKHLGLLLNIPPCENQHDLLRELGKIAFVDDNILSVFHKLRRIGNQAVHEYHNDLNDAQMCLRLGFRLAVWYYRLVTKDYDFPVPVFVLRLLLRHWLGMRRNPVKTRRSQAPFATRQTLRQPGTF